MDKDSRIEKALYSLGFQGSAIVRSSDLDDMEQALKELEVPYSLRRWTTGLWKFETSAEVPNG